jgi:5-methylcytosine-specific restriction endonuclease McrA
MSKMKYLIIFILPLVSFSSPGRTNSDGCHTESATGIYHCHKEVTPIVPYDRNLYKHWIDEDRDGENTREEVLIRDSKTGLKEDGSVVITCRYTGQVLLHRSLVDIDHLVPLKEAHISGADRWSSQKREEFANYLKDNYTLVAVRDSVNQSKGSKDPSEWMPEINKCEYLSNWISVKKKFGLFMDMKEKSFIDKEIKNCP